MIQGAQAPEDTKELQVRDEINKGKKSERQKRKEKKTEISRAGSSPKARNGYQRHRTIFPAAATTTLHSAYVLTFHAFLHAMLFQLFLYVH